MVGGDQLVLPMVWLTTGYLFLPIQGTQRQLLGPVHPVDAGVYVMLVRGPNLEYPSHPVVGLLGNLGSTGGQGVLSFHGGLVRYIDKVFGIILDAVDYTDLYN
jgi:hypothetical protein